MPRIDPDTVDFLESGTGPVVILVHSSVSGARQWRKLMERLTPSFHVKAVNLFGYGRTPGWPETQTQTLDDQAELIEAILPDNAGKVHLVGHSFGGTVAMAAARRLGPLTGRLVLLEPNPFFLLRDNGRDEAFAEVVALKDFIKSCGVQGKWMEAAERFGDYWGGEGTWAATDAYRRRAFADAIKPNFHEWDAVLGEATPLQAWAEALPDETLVVHDPRTVRPIREIVELLRGATTWRFETLDGVGHMAPLTHPDLVNPVVGRFLAPEAG